MKIQSTTSNTAPSKLKKTKQSSGNFNAVLSSQIEDQQAVQPTEQKTEQQAAPQQQQPDIEQTLHTLEHALLQLESGSESQQQAQDAITDLRQALRSNPNLAKMSPKDLQEADTLLAVEAKRLASLNKV
ncbi:MAG: hypothetical protein R8M46_09430 [Ghiorsea sp.]